MNRVVAGVAAVAVAVSLGACATLTRGTVQPFVVETTPAGAAVKTSNGFTCPATPCTFSMPRKEAFTVTVSKEGYATQTAEVKSEMAGGGAAGMAGNVLLGGLIGIGVDATSGALNDLTPNPLLLVMQASVAPLAPAASDPAPAAASVAEATTAAEAGGS
jgi:hypothetical protein